MSELTKFEKRCYDCGLRQGRAEMASELEAARTGTHKVVKEAAESAERARVQFEAQVAELRAQKEALEKELNEARTMALQVVDAMNSRGSLADACKAARSFLEAPHEAK